MINYLNGKIIKKGGNFAVLLVAGIGYKIYASEAAVLDLPAGTEIELWTHHHIREDAADLYGFTTSDKLEMFDLLLNVNGIGPKSAMGVMSAIGVEDLKSAIATGDLAMLTKISGIGKKTAERLILDLKDKIGFLSPLVGDIGGSARGEEIEALEALGYSLQQAREALAKVDKTITDSGKRIKEALKNIK
jgi:Holliday junction DNA helicase RuvA